MEWHAKELTNRSPAGDISVVALIRTNATLDHIKRLRGYPEIGGR